LNGNAAFEQDTATTAPASVAAILARPKTVGYRIGSITGQ
jgi:hypothetical protein